ncbi:MAG: Ig-like domain-containing protein [Candidatus Dojkabacteria bacterium]|nr:MAG: Ig-like domain-containing protein [Candidatus Dojkabacteria bacterium]
MKAPRLSKRKRLKASVIASAFVVLAIPLAVYALVQGDSFDSRSDATEAAQVNLCAMNFIYVNPESIQEGSVTQIGLTGNVQEEGEYITDLSITDESGAEIYQRGYDDQPTQIAEAFTYTARIRGEARLLGVMQTNVRAYPCVLADSRGNVLSVVTENSAPVFNTDPYTSATPSSVIGLEDTYRYQLRATDPDGDNIRYAYSFTPGADWLRMNVVEDGSDGSLVLDFTGTPEDYASFLANVFIHDGYNTHLRSQSWVISVEPTENDIPVVTITEPANRIEITAGDMLTIAWSATDRNQITQYRLYIATNPGNSNTWIAIDENLSYQVGRYLLDTSNLVPGIYKVIVQAVDNQDPAAIGTGVSQEIAVNSILPPVTDPDDPDKDPDDGPVIIEPQVTNIQPANKSTVTNERVTISATLIAADNTEVDLDSIVFKVDEEELTDKLDVAEITASEVKIIYRPTEDLEIGEHQIYVEFETSDGKKGSREWTFELESGDGDDDYFNILGFQISKRTAYIIGAGLVVLLLALMIPWLLYLAWRDDEDEYEYDIYPTAPPPPDEVTYTKGTVEVETEDGSTTYTPVVYKPEEGMNTPVKKSDEVPVVKSSLVVGAAEEKAGVNTKLEHVVIPERTIVEKSTRESSTATPTSLSTVASTAPAPTSVSSAVSATPTSAGAQPSGGTQVFQTAGAKPASQSTTPSPTTPTPYGPTKSSTTPTPYGPTQSSTTPTPYNPAPSDTKATTASTAASSAPNVSKDALFAMSGPAATAQPTQATQKTESKDSAITPTPKKSRPGVEYPPSAAFSSSAKPEVDDSMDSSELQKLAEELKKESDDRTSLYSDKQKAAAPTVPMTPAAPTTSMPAPKPVTAASTTPVASPKTVAPATPASSAPVIPKPAPTSVSSTTTNTPTNAPVATPAPAPVSVSSAARPNTPAPVPTNTQPTSTVNNASFGASTPPVAAASPATPPTASTTTPVTTTTPTQPAPPSVTPTASTSQPSNPAQPQPPRF